MDNEALIKEKNKNYKELFVKILPFFILVVIGLTIGLSMIGNFYRVEIGEEKVIYHLYDLIAGKDVGISLTLFYVINYLALPIISAILLFFNKYHKNFAFVSLFLLLFSAIVSIVSKDVFVSLLENKLGTSCSFDKIYFCGVIPTISYFVLSTCILSFAINDVGFTTRDITESGVLIAAALGLNFIRLFPAPTGGSVNLQMLPLFLLAIRRGPLKGFIGCGIVYGLISCLTDGWGFAYFPFDYLLGFGGASFLGFFSTRILPSDKDNYNFKGELYLAIGAIGATFIRFVGGTISSMIFYDLDLTGAMLYNVGYVFISGGLALAILMALYGPLLKINRRFPPQKI